MTPDPDDPGTPNCTTEQKGQPCSTPGKACEPPGDSCGGTLLCTDTDPTNGGNCPISLARYKRDIHYLEAAELERVHGELLAMRLASWRYRSEPAGGGREHLGFLIDDAPQSAAVAASGRHVDLYGYASMATAAIQVQDRRIEALEREIAALREGLAARCR